MAKKRFFVYNGRLGQTCAAFVNETRTAVYFMHRWEDDPRWFWGIENRRELTETVPEDKLGDFIKKLVGNPFPIFMEFEGRSAEVFGLVRDSENLVKSLERR